ncbi:histone deacetylase 8-like isoform X1 [Acropora millepora]|uniref:histone deacetylase 8-like isoform X1 n=1 Tax=Acropora millepora TaxID=45264 RepID=UPI001CF1966B|nr:histone deacetylase 8-like isoform X1 [Acropora millepora]
MALRENGGHNPKSTGKNPKVSLIHSDELIKLCDKLPKVPNRATLTHSLIKAYGLLENVRLVQPRPASVSELAAFHSMHYIECLEQVTNCSDCEEIVDIAAAEYGIGFDCPVFDELFHCVSIVAGGTLTAAELLNKQECNIAINWEGGWHHAHRDEAGGFCYVNDVVLGILKLREKFDRVLYIDIDLHHGDGVEDAFSFTSKVMSVSFHKFSPGFFPGTGSHLDVGEGKGKYYTVNVPLKDGIADNLFVRIFSRILSEVQLRFKPKAVVCQCGVDTLAGDPMASFNLTHHGIGECVKYLMDWNLPLLLLGGGGYNVKNAAKCWTYLTGLVLNQPLSPDIPEHEHFLSYGPDYQLDIPPGRRHDKNTKEDLVNLLNTLSGPLMTSQITSQCS